MNKPACTVDAADGQQGLHAAAPTSRLQACTTEEGLTWALALYHRKAFFFRLPGALSGKRMNSTTCMQSQALTHKAVLQPSTSPSRSTKAHDPCNGHSSPRAPH